MAFNSVNTNEQLQQIINLLGGGYERVPNSDITATAENINDTSGIELLPFAGDGFKWAITQVLVTNTSSTVATKVRFTTITTNFISGEVGTNGGGFSIDYGSAPLICNENGDVTLTCVTTGSDINVSINAYKIAV